MPTIRALHPSDWPAVEAIYAAGIATGNATFETEPPSWEEFDAAKMNAAIGQEIKRREAAGRDPRFKAFGRGRYGLTTPVDPLGGAIDRKNREVRERLRAILAEMDPRQFEHLIGELLVALGYEDVEVTRYSADGGIDVRGALSVGGVTEVRTAIQVKRWAKSVSGRTVRELRGGLGPHERGLIITLSDFTKDARREAAELDRSPISLINGEQLVDVLVDREIGVTTRRLTVLELDEAAFSPGDADEAPPGEAESEPVALDTARWLRPTFDKALSVWPLPGGNDAWKNTLDRMLSFAAESAPTMREAIDWTIESFERVASEKVVRGYWQVLRSFGSSKLRASRSSSQLRVPSTSKTGRLSDCSG